MCDIRLHTCSQNVRGKEETVIHLNTRNLHAWHYAFKILTHMLQGLSFKAFLSKSMVVKYCDILAKIASDWNIVKISFFINIRGFLRGDADIRIIWVHLLLRFWGKGKREWVRQAHPVLGSWGTDWNVVQVHYSSATGMLLSFIRCTISRTLCGSRLQSFTG